MSVFIKCLPFNNVAPGSRATVDFKNLIGFGIDRIILELGGLTKAQIDAIQIKAGAKVIVDSTGARMDSRMQYRGITANAGFLTIDFSEIRSKTIKGQKLGIIDTTMIPQLTGEFQIDGAAVNPTLAAHAECSYLSEIAALYDKNERALIGKVLNQTYNFAGAGTFPVPLPYGRLGGSLIKRIHFFGATVTGAQIKKNGIVIHDSTQAVLDYVQTEYQRVPQANIYTVDFIEDGNQSNVLNAANAQTMEYYITTNGAGNVTAEVELLDPLANN